MDKVDFINRIISLYPHAIVDKQAQFDTYNRALSKNKIDFDKLMDIFAQEYKDSFPPPAAILNEMSLKCCMEEEISQAQKWIHVKVFNPIYNAVTDLDCFPAGTSEKVILNTYKKRFGGEGWRLIEVY